MLDEIKSKYILKKIFSNIKNRIILKIIKYSKIMMFRLNVTKTDFKAYESLKEFNEKLELNIRDIDINELDLSKKCINNEDIKYLSLVNFKGLKKLLLNDNYISDINELANFQFPKIEILNLSNNKISDINIL